MSDTEIAFVFDKSRGLIEKKVPKNPDPQSDTSITTQSGTPVGGGSYHAQGVIAAPTVDSGIPGFDIYPETLLWTRDGVGSEPQAGDIVRVSYYLFFGNTSGGPATPNAIPMPLPFHPDTLNRAQWNSWDYDTSGTIPLSLSNGGPGSTEYFVYINADIVGSGWVAIDLTYQTANDVDPV